MGLFSKTKNAVQAATQVLETAIAPQITAEAIQREIVMKQEQLLQEARDILSAATPDQDKANRLKALGFTATKEVSDVAEAEKRREAANTIAACEQDAATKYPGFRFISKDVMTEVCKKYSLVLGGVDRYQGEVPDWAIAAIERSGIVKKKWAIQISSLIKLDSEFRYEWRDVNLCDTEELARSCISGWSGLGERIVERTNLLIAATQAEMVVKSNERVQDGRIVKVEDPIVCVEVTGGYVVLCAWGEEGREPMVFNSLNN